MRGPIRDKLRAQRPEREVICAAISHDDHALRWDIPCEMSQWEGVFSVSAADLAIIVQGPVLAEFAPAAADHYHRRPEPELVDSRSAAQAAQAGRSDRALIAPRARVTVTNQVNAAS